MYEVLNRKVQNFRKYLSEEDEVRKNVKKINYYWFMGYFNMFKLCLLICDSDKWIEMGLNMEHFQLSSF